MASALLISNLLLWLVVIALALSVYALVRQIGVLHERVFPAGALATASGPRVGEAVAPLTVTSLSGERIALGAPSDASTFILFVSPQCPVCKTLIPLLASVGNWESGEGSLNIFLASDGDHADHHAFVRDRGIDPDRYVVSRELGLQFMVDKLPFAVLIDELGVLRAKGLVNSREHLESLFEARRRGVGTLQEHFQKEGLLHEVA